MTRSTTFAPSFELAVNGLHLPNGVTQFVRQVEFESTDGYPDEIRVTVANPSGELSRRRIFAPGNFIELWLTGDDTPTDLVRAASAKITKVRPRFGSEDSTIEIIAHTRDIEMTKNAPPASKKGVKVKSRGRVYKFLTRSAAVAELAIAYGFKPDIDDPPDVEWSQLQPVGMTDFEFVQALSNETGFIWWVDVDLAGDWTLHFKNPDKFRVQEDKIIFIYDDENANFEAELEETFQDVLTELIVQSHNPYTGKTMIAEVSKTDFALDEKFIGNIDAERTDPKHPTPVLIAAGEVKVEVVADRPFQFEKQMIEWAKQWFVQNASRFISGRVGMPGIGLQDLRARQVHEFRGLHSPYDGDYYFTKVRHTLSGEGPYMIDADVRKILK